MSPLAAMGGQEEGELCWAHIWGSGQLVPESSCTWAGSVLGATLQAPETVGLTHHLLWGSCIASTLFNPQFLAENKVSLFV